jgi:hypothetical protein
MTRLRQIALGGAAAALLMGGAVSKSFAIESGAFQYLAGASIGIPAGAAAPPGLYAAFEPFWGITGGMTGNFGGTGPNGGRGTSLGSLGGVVPFVWSTGWNVFGASYSVAIIQPFATAIVNVTGANVANNGLGSAIWQQMILNTVWQPLNMSWNLGNGWFTSIAFSFAAPIGTHVLGIANPDFWTIQPGFAISYLSANWVGTVNMSYNIYTASQGNAMNLGGTPFGVGYTSGNQFVGDWDLLWKFGKWSIGPVGYWVWQTTNDTAGGGGCAALANPTTGIPGFGCARQSFVGVGGLIGYDFGPVDMQVWVTDTVWQQNTGQSGVTVFSRIGFKIWGPEAPVAHPLVSKN